MASHLDVSRLLTHKHFTLETQTDEEEPQAVYCRHTAANLTFINVPLNDNIPDVVVHNIMKSAGIPYEEYRNIVNSPPKV